MTTDEVLAARAAEGLRVSIFPASTGWLERVHGIDMERFRADLGKLAEPYVRMKCQHAEIGGVWFVFDGALLVTVVPTQPKSPHRHDRYTVNGSGTGAEKQTWQSMKRKRSHK